MLTRRAFHRVLLAGFAAASLVSLPACGGDETSPEEGHTPASIRLYSGGVQLNAADLTFTASQTVRVEVRFFADDGDEITGLEDEHDIAITASPSTLLTVAEVPGEKFQRDLTAGAAGTGTITVGFGHHGETDELTFGPYPVTVQ